MRRPRLLPLASALGLAFTAGCSGRPESGPVGIAVSYLDSGGSRVESLPAGVLRLEIDVVDGPVLSQMLSVPVSTLDPAAPQTRIIGLPTGRPLGMRVRAYDAATAGTLLYVGQANGIVLQPGERRYVAVTLFDATVATTLPMAPSFALGTATMLDDGRVLALGGVASLAAQPCPPDLPGATVCLRGDAVAQATLYDTGGGTFLTPPRQPRVARAGHTATKLPDGRVLIAGGADAVWLGFVPNPVGGYAIRIAPAPDPAATPPRVGALTNFEIFDPNNPPADPQDADRNGDLARGGFTGGDAQSPTAFPHFLGAAAALPQTSRVVVAGGVPVTPATGREVEIFDEQRGGFVPTSGLEMALSRAGHTAVGVRVDRLVARSEVWIFGGAAGPTRDADTVEVYLPPDAMHADGTLVPSFLACGAVPANCFPPSDLAPTATGHPDMNLVGATASVLGDGATIVVSGWYADQCDNVGNPTYAATFACLAATRTFSVDTALGLYYPALAGSGLHAFGAVASLPGGGAVMGGGTQDLLWGGMTAAQRFLPALDPTTLAPQTDAAFATRFAGISLPVFLSAAGLPDGSVLFWGGVTIDHDATNTITGATVATTATFLPGG